MSSSSQFCASCERFNQQRAAVWFHVSWLISAPYRFNTCTSLKYYEVVTVTHLFSKWTHLLTGSFTHLMCWMTVSNWIMKRVINVCWSERWWGSQQFGVKSVYLSQEAVKHNMSALFWLISQTFSASTTCTYLNVIYCVRVMIIKTQLLYFSQRNSFFFKGARRQHKNSVAQRKHKRRQNPVNKHKSSHFKIKTFLGVSCKTR